MDVPRPEQSIQWLDEYTRQYGEPQKDPAAVPRLTRAIAGYLHWMESVNYTPASRHLHRMQLERFLDFVKRRRLGWQNLFTVATRERFKKISGLCTTVAVNGLSRYLVEQGQLKTPLPKCAHHTRLPRIYEDYLQFRQDSRQNTPRQLNAIRRVLSAVCDHFNAHGITLQHLGIEQLDCFMAEFFRPFSAGTCRNYRSIVRGFLRYLYQQRGVLKKNLAPLVVGAPQFANAKPPKFLRPHQVQQLFDSLSVASPKALRTYAMVHLAYTLGLRPEEISCLRLDDIAFTKAQLSVDERKNKQPLTLPIPEQTLKAVVAYIVGGRPKSKDRHLILSLSAPYGPIVPGVVARYIQQAMQKAALNSTAYWLRHTYAQHLLSCGASIYEIKEMLGHRHIQSSRKYLHIHTELMREIILNETL